MFRLIVTKREREYRQIEDKFFPLNYAYIAAQLPKLARYIFGLTNNNNNNKKTKRTTIERKERIMFLFGRNLEGKERKGIKSFHPKREEK